MSGHGLNGSNGSRRQRVGAVTRRKNSTRARKAAWRKIVADSGVTPSKEVLDALLRELRRE